MRVEQSALFYFQRLFLLLVNGDFIDRLGRAQCEIKRGASHQQLAWNHINDELANIGSPIPAVDPSVLTKDYVATTDSQ